MWTAIGDALPLATGLTLSPLAVITGIVLLLGDRGRAKTALFVTHRLSTARLADRIVALRYGRVVDDETWDTLSAAPQLLHGLLKLLENH
ncbi:hypothetical protein ACFVW2_01680 [Streptomyces sp. NPDC058171]